MQLKLTAATVRQLIQEIPAKELVAFDLDLRRFALRIKPSGASWYFVRYVGPDGRERKYRIGSPATMSLDEARKAARTVLSQD